MEVGDLPPLLSVVEGMQVLEGTIGILKTDILLADAQCDGRGLAQVIQESEKGSTTSERHQRHCILSTTACFLDTSQASNLAVNFPQS